MKLKTATTLAIIGAILLLVSYLFDLFQRLFNAMTDVNTAVAIYKTQSILNTLGAIMLILFFISFLSAQKKRG